MYKEIIENAWEDKVLLKEKQTIEAIRETIELLDKGKLRVAEKVNNEWLVNSGNGNY